MGSSWQKAKGGDYAIAESVGGQVLFLDAQETGCFGGKPAYSFYFRILNKKKQNSRIEHVSTGKIGLTGLIWAKAKILEFASDILTRHDPVLLLVRWEDNRRRRVYERGLRDAGFKYGMFMYNGKSRKYLYREFTNTFNDGTSK